MKLWIPITLIVFTAVGCTTTQKGTTAGALAGAGLGTIIGHQNDKDAEGAAIGAAVGALGGYMVGEKIKKKFCPVGGEQYDAKVVYCPTHGVELKFRQ